MKILVDFCSMEIFVDIAANTEYSVDGTSVNCKILSTYRVCKKLTTFSTQELKKQYNYCVYIACAAAVPLEAVRVLSGAVESLEGVILTLPEYSKNSLSALVFCPQVQCNNCTNNHTHNCKCHSY
uniref:Uncharacterized protein n=1 Tax=Arion vulgaris TaxID=1028688 RepID=A0A0B7A8K3_9EUPU